MKAPAYADAQAIAEDLIDRFDSGQFDVAHLAYANSSRCWCRSRPSTRSSRSRPAGPRRGGSASLAAVEYEPDEEEILADLLPRNVAIQFYRALLENMAGFYGSADDRDGQCHPQRGRHDQSLSIQYNRQRQAAITTELVEIISGAEAL